MKLLKIGISGVRGIVGDSITPKLVMDFAAAFGTYVNSKPVLLGRDTRISGPMLQAACLASLLSTGCDVLDLDICPTPILQYAVKKLKAKGGISITAGHNDIQWNALAFINQDGTYLNPYQGAEVLDTYHLGRFKKVSTDGLGEARRVKGRAKGSPLARSLYRRASTAEVDPWAEPGAPAAVENYADEYFAGLRAFLDAETIGKARLKVVIDACNGAGAYFLEGLARALGFELIPVNNEPNGFFPHDPEPRPRNAQQVVAIMKVVGADIGFLLNSDVSRVSGVTETGESLSEEFTFPLVANEYLKDHRGPVVANLSTSRMIEDVARDRGCPLVRTKVGQSFAVHALLQEEAVLAGEGSGGVAIADFQPAFDSFLTMGFILQTMARRGQKISRLVAELPRYHIVKEKIYCPPTKVHSVVSEVKKIFRRHEIDTSDGIRVEDKTGWVQVRTSGTEPMIRIIAEDQNKAKARARADEVIRFIDVLIQ
jgi:phosphomannomutase